ncbi:hypothetical protein [Streptococcus suis]|uniref:hypothetical protein n=1 Tax=Streptococcus suis TaxID=1307 RepID=UPI001FC92BA5
MCKQLRYRSLLLLSILTLHAALPTVALAETYENPSSMMTEVTSEEDAIISEINSQLETVQFAVIDDATLKISYADGRVDILEKRYDGVYLNGAFIEPYQKASQLSRSYNPNTWNHVSTIRGNVLENTFSNHLINSGISWGLGKIVAAIGGPWRAVVGVAFWAISTYDAWMQSQSPYPYYITDTYIHLGQRKWKFVIRFYKNSDYTGYVKTETKYANF